MDNTTVRLYCTTDEGRLVVGHGVRQYGQFWELPNSEAMKYIQDYDGYSLEPPNEKPTREYQTKLPEGLTQYLASVKRTPEDCAIKQGWDIEWYSALLSVANEIRSETRAKLENMSLEFSAITESRAELKSLFLSGENVILGITQADSELAALTDILAELKNEDVLLQRRIAVLQNHQNTGQHIIHKEQQRILAEEEKRKAEEAERLEAYERFKWQNRRQAPEGGYPDTPEEWETMKIEIERAKQQKREQAAQPQIAAQKARAEEIKRRSREWLEGVK